MPRLQVRIEVVDDAGRARLLATADEPTRLDVDRDPMYVFARLESLTARAVAVVHDQALAIDQESPRG